MLADLESHGCWDPSSLSWMYGGQRLYHSGGHQMVPHLTAILHRLTGAWAMRLQPDAMLAVCREIG
jgi:hypothetical protein